MRTGKDSLPLIVDFDGTLCPGDLLHESLVFILLRKPWLLIEGFWIWIKRGRAPFKRFLAENGFLEAFDPTRLPYRKEVLEAVKDEHSSGREIYLYTGSDELLARKISKSLGVFLDAKGSDGELNLSAENKCRALVERFGEGGFEYWGDSKKDLSIWKSAKSAGLIARPESALFRLIPKDKIKRSFYINTPSEIKEAFRALRPLQWAKNALVFLPLIFGKKYSDPFLCAKAFVSFCMFSSVASMIYLLNDLRDLDSDRARVSKKNRPLAKGTLPVVDAMILIPMLLLFALGLGIAGGLSLTHNLLLGVYAVGAMLYTWKVKEWVGADVLFLACFFTLRIFVGGEATGILVSQWLFTFSLFFFLSLALLKRYTELIAGEGKVQGRGYREGDQEVLRLFGVSSALASLLVLVLYFGDLHSKALYFHANRLWFIMPLALLGVMRMWVYASRGEVGEDPVQFALKDRIHYLLLAGIALVLYSAGL